MSQVSRASAAWLKKATSLEYSGADAELKIALKSEDSDLLEAGYDYSPFSQLPVEDMVESNLAQADDSVRYSMVNALVARKGIDTKRRAALLIKIMADQGPRYFNYNIDSVKELISGESDVMRHR